MRKILLEFISQNVMIIGIKVGVGYFVTLYIYLYFENRKLNKIPCRLQITHPAFRPEVVVFSHNCSKNIIFSQKNQISTVSEKKIWRMTCLEDFRGWSCNSQLNKKQKQDYERIQPGELTKKQLFDKCFLIILKRTSINEGR